MRSEAERRALAASHRGFRRVRKLRAAHGVFLPPGRPRARRLPKQCILCPFANHALCDAFQVELDNRARRAS
jgi:hypothetical protein